MAGYGAWIRQFSGQPLIIVDDYDQRNAFIAKVQAQMDANPEAFNVPTNDNNNIIYSRPINPKSTLTGAMTAYDREYDDIEISDHRFDTNFEAAKGWDSKTERRKPKDMSRSPSNRLHSKSMRQLYSLPSNPNTDSYSA